MLKKMNGLDGNATSIIIALIAVIGTMGGAIIWFAKWAMNNFSRDLKAHTQAADKNTTSNNKLARAVDNFDAYLRERNGRDAEIHKELINMQKGIVDAVGTLPDAMQKVADASSVQVIQALKVVDKQLSAPDNGDRKAK